ncbi:hypothetical protein [Luteimonas sp. SDU101]|uniref:hypothetical protein n=1 Tax=Luteimonas sp. SDU101 TaxID=3422593 RepID=UPI003EBEA87C
MAALWTLAGERAVTSPCEGAPVARCRPAATDGTRTVVAGCDVAATPGVGRCLHTATGSSRMHLVQLFLPLRDNEGRAFDRSLFAAVRDELTDQFGGVTAFARAPAVGAWEDDAGRVQRDEVVLVEVMATQLDHGWWAAYRLQLQRRFRQDEVLVRAMGMERL